MSLPTARPPLRILLADDHGIVLEGLKMMLGSMPAAVGPIDEAATGEQVLALLAAHGADLLVLDLGMPGVSGSAWVRALRAAYPALRILVLTANTDARTRAAVLEAGADEYLAKTGNPRALLAAIVQLADGPVRARAPQAALPAVPAETLTPREQQVLARAALGATAAQIAADLHISPYTARKHRENLMRKLALHSTAELVAYAVRLGLPAA